MTQSPDFPTLPFIQARNYTRGTVGRRETNFIVLHTIESPEVPSIAESTAMWFAGSNAPRVSAHFTADNDSIVQCVRLSDVAWAAPGKNSDGVQIEMSGRAGSTTAEWKDSYSLALMDRVADLCVSLSVKCNIPLRYRDYIDLRQGGLHGITTHNQVTRAYPELGTGHWDPGPFFPMDSFIKLCWSKANVPIPPPKPSTGWPKPVPAWFWLWATWRLEGKKGPRPSSAPLIIPPWAWRRLSALLDARKVV